MTWDGESYCTDCHRWPATVQRLAGMVDHVPLVELVCEHCAGLEDMSS